MPSLLLCVIAEGCGTGCAVTLGLNWQALSKNIPLIQTSLYILFFAIVSAGDHLWSVVGLIEF